MVKQSYTNDSALRLKSYLSSGKDGIPPELSFVSDAVTFPQYSHLLSFGGIFTCKWNLSRTLLSFELVKLT